MTILESNLQLHDLSQRSNWIRDFCRVYARLTAALTALSVILVFAGWAFSIDFLKSGIPGTVAMNPLTALSFLLAAASLFLRLKGTLHSFATALGFTVFFFGAGKISALLMGKDFFDIVFFAAELGENRMAPNTAIGHLFLGLALALPDYRRKNFPPGEIAALLTLLVGLLALIGYIYDAKAFYTLSRFISMAVPTAFLLVALSSAALCLHPDKGFLGLLTGVGPGSALLRNTVPFTLFFPVLFGLVRIYGERAGLYGSGIGAALLVTTLIPAFTIFAVRFALAQNRNDLLFQNQNIVLHSILDHLADGVMVADQEGKVVLQNSAAKQLLPEELSPFSSQGSGDHEDIELEVNSPSGERTWLSIIERPILDLDGKRNGVVALIRNITNRKRAEELLREKNIGLEKEVAAKGSQLASAQSQLLQLQKMDAIGRLAGGMAHDFNNMLAALEMYCEVMAGDIGKPEALKDSIVELRKITERGAGLTRQLLVFSRKQIVNVQAIHLNSLVQNMEKMLRRLLPESMELETRLDKEAGFVKGDGGQFEQVLLNLLVNARDAMPKGGKVLIETKWVELDSDFAATHLTTRPGSNVMLSVSDTGMGMTTETKSRLFEPFFTTKEAGQGTGLGLSTVYGIVKQFGGSIWVYSELGKGSVFKIYFPELGSGEIRQMQPLEPQVIAGRTGATILLVDDDSRLAKLFTKVLIERGFKVFTANSPEEAEKIADEQGENIDILITDVIMPRTNGFDLASGLRSRRPDLKVLYISGYTDQNHEKLVDDPAFRYSYLQKPFTAQALVNKISEVLRA